MRTWTLGVSIVVHLCVMAGVIVSPLLATGDLPEPPRATEHVLVSARMPNPPAPPRPARVLPVPNGAPIVAQNGVAPEPIAQPQQAEPIDFGIGGTNDAGTGFLPGTSGVVAGNDLVPPAAPVAPRPAVRVGGDIRPPQKIRDVAPRYPAIAQASKVEGVVILEATIGEDGSVRDVRVLRGKPLLDDAAADAVRQWRFTPTLLNGEPVPVVMTVTVAFALR